MSTDLIEADFRISPGRAYYRRLAVSSGGRIEKYALQLLNEYTQHLSTRGMMHGTHLV